MVKQVMQFYASGLHGCDLASKAYFHEQVFQDSYSLKYIYSSYACHQYNHM